MKVGTKDVNGHGQSGRISCVFVASQTDGLDLLSLASLLCFMLPRVRTGGTIPSENSSMTEPPLLSMKN